MKSSDMMVWALAMLEFKQPVAFERAPDFSALQVSPPTELRLQFTTYRDADPRLVVEVPMQMVLRADDEAETLDLTIESAHAPHAASRSALAGIAETMNRLGRCSATWYDAEGARLVIGSRLRHELEFRDSADPDEAASIQKQMTANWLADVAEVAVQAAAAINEASST